MKKINFDGCKSIEEIEERIKDALKYDTIVKDSDAAEAWFVGNFEFEHPKIVWHECIDEDIVPIWNEEMGGDEYYKVRIYAHYIDSGSDDYIYSYGINLTYL